MLLPRVINARAEIAGQHCIGFIEEPAKGPSTRIVAIAGERLDDLCFEQFVAGRLAGDPLGCSCKFPKGLPARMLNAGISE